MRSPIDYLQNLINAGLHVLWNRHLHSRFGGPGKIIETQPPEVRESLTQLKSDDMAKIRFEPYLVMDDKYEENKRQVQERLDFDKKIRK